MSLSAEQNQDLKKIGKHLREIEKLVIENNIDLDVFMTDYNDSGFAVYATEKVSLNEVAEARKNVFQKSENNKTKSEKNNF